MKKVTMVRRPCPVCSSRDASQVFVEENFDPARLDRFAFASRKFPEHMYFRLLTCPTCDTLYANPLPTQDHIGQGYQEADFDSSAESHYAAKTYGRLLSDILDHVPDKVGALDIGTGDGAFLEQLLEHGFERVAGSEPSKAPIAAAKKNIRPLIKQGLFEPKRYKKGSFSLISCFQTIEHLYRPMEICSGAYSLLKEGGAFFIVCHNRRALSAKILGLKSPIYDIEHLQLFSPKSAKFMLERAGFRDVTVKTVLNSYPLNYWVKLLPLPKGLKIVLIKFLEKVWLGKMPVTMPVGNLAVIGYKRSK
jgi:SAM-dependent methyltransferase